MNPCPSRTCALPELVAKRLSLRPSANLLLEQILKSLTSIVGALGRGRGCLLLDHHSHRVKRALVALVFARNAFRNRLGALKAAGRIEVRALLAGVQFETTFGTLPDWIADRLQNRSALRTARDAACPGHLDRPRTECVLLDRPFGRLALLTFVTAILIAVLPVFQCGSSSNCGNIVSLQLGDDKWTARIVFPQSGCYDLWSYH